MYTRRGLDARWLPAPTFVSFCRRRCGVEGARVLTAPHIFVLSYRFLSLFFFWSFVRSYGRSFHNPHSLTHICCICERRCSNGGGMTIIAEVECGTFDARNYNITILAPHHRPASVLRFEGAKKQWLMFFRFITGFCCFVRPTAGGD